MGSSTDPCYIQNRVITNRIIKRLRCISLLMIVNDAAVADIAAAAFISHVTLVNDATFALVNIAAVEVFNLSVPAVAVNNAVAVALITD